MERAQATREPDTTATSSGATPATGAADSSTSAHGPGEMRAQQLLTSGCGPEQIGDLVGQFPVERDAILSAVHHQRGNAFAGEVMAAGFPGMTKLPKLKLAPEARAKLIEDAKDRMVAAAAYFQVAVQKNQSALASAAKKDADLLGLVFDIGMGFLIPGLGNKLSSRLAVLKSLGGAGTKTWVDRTMNFFASPDAGKAMVTGITKTAVSKLKQQSDIFANSEGEAFLAQLATAYAMENQTTRESLDSKSDEEIAAVFAAYDVAHVNVNTYTAEIRNTVVRFEKQVASINKLEDGGFGLDMFKYGQRAAWIQGPGFKRLANVSVVRRQVPDTTREPGSVYPTSKRVEQDEYQFVSWIDNDMAKMASERSREFEAIKTLDVDDVRRVPA